MDVLMEIPREVRLFLQNVSGTSASLRLQAATPSLCLSAAAAALLVSTASYAFYKWYRLSHIPGPFWTPYSLFRLLSRGKVYEDFPALNEKYGPLVRIGPNIVMYSDPDTFARVVGVRSLYTKGSFYSSVAISPATDNVFSETGPEEHKALRAKLAGGYSGREHGGFEPAIDTVISSFIALLESKYISTAATTRPLEMAKRAQFFSLDVVSAVGHGRAFGFLGEDKDLHGFLRDTDAYWPLLALVVCIPGMTGLFNAWPFTLVMPRIGDRSGTGALLGMAHDDVEERLKGGKKGTDMLQSFIDAGLSRKELEGEMYVETLAGSDTVATALRMTLLLLLTSPRAYATLQFELDAAISSHKVSRPILSSEARALPYLQAVIREGLRLYPPATGAMTKVVPPGGDTVAGYRVPGGTELAVNIVGITRCREVFGEDADVFRPERWLEGDVGGPRWRRMAGTVDMVFGGGRNTCPGRTIALMEINKLIPELFRRYDMAILKPEQPLRLFHGIFWVTNDFFIRVTRREIRPDP